MSNITRLEQSGEQPLLIITACNDCIRMLAYLANGKQVVSLVGGTIRIWNMENGEEDGRSMNSFPKKVTALCVTQDGTKIISRDMVWTVGCIRVWNVESHEVMNKWVHQDSPRRVLGLETAFPPDSHVESEEVINDWVQENISQVPGLHHCELAVSPDNRLIAVGGSRLCLYTMEGKQVGHHHDVDIQLSISSVCFSPDSHKLAYGDGDEIYVYNVETKKFLGEPKGHGDTIQCLLWSHDGRKLFSASRHSKLIHCWDSDTGRQIGQPWTGHTHFVRSISLSPDGSMLASASLDCTVRLWNATSGDPIGQCFQHVDRVCAVAFSPSGRSVVSAGSHGWIYSWSLPSSDPPSNQGLRA